MFEITLVIFKNAIYISHIKAPDLIGYAPCNTFANYIDDIALAESSLAVTADLGIC